MATVLHLRLALPDDTLAHLLGTSRTTIRRALTEIRDLLDQHGHHIEPVTAPPGLPARIPPYVPQTAGNTENEINNSVLIICKLLVVTWLGGRAIFGRGDGLAPQRVHQIRLETIVLE